MFEMFPVPFLKLSYNYFTPSDARRRDGAQCARRGAAARVFGNIYKYVLKRRVACDIMN